MKTGSIVCLAIFVIAAVLLILQLWFGIMSADLFIKVMITLAILFVVALGITLVKKEYVEDKKMKGSGYIDS